MAQLRTLEKRGGDGTPQGRSEIIDENEIKVVDVDTPLGVNGACRDRARVKVKDTVRNNSS